MLLCCGEQMAAISLLGTRDSPFTWIKIYQSKTYMPYIGWHNHGIPNAQSVKANTSGSLQPLFTEILIQEDDEVLV